MALAQNGSWGVISPNRTIYKGQVAGVYLASGAGNLSTSGLTGSLQQATGRGWITVGVRKIDSKGRASFMAKPSASSYFRVLVHGNKLVASSVSNAIRINVSNKGVAVVAAASKQKGKMYQYGAAGPSRFDCSGYTQYIYKQFGRSLPHSATKQGGIGTYVAKNAARPGDLLVFGRPGAYHHAGIFAGNGKMWDSSTSGQPVALRKIWSNNYTVRRLV